MSKVAILRHSEGTPPGSVPDWLNSRGFVPVVHELHRGDKLPALSDVQAVVVLGGPMNVDDVHDHPWLLEEKAFLKEAVRSGVPCVGLCLGAQLLAQTLGARVEKNQHWEVGWHDVRVQDGDVVRVFQWHQDMFSLPPGAVRLATNEITLNQAFMHGDRVLAFQFHPESTDAWVRECAEEDPYPKGPHVQNAEQVLEGIKHLPQMREWFFGELDRFFERALRRL